MTTRAAGILFLAPDGTALFLKRGPGGDHPGEWCFPGGTTEADETADQTAERETIEELGFLPEGARALLTRQISNNEVAGPLGQVVNPDLPPGDAIVVPGEQVDYTTFLQRVPERFEPVLNGEHTGFAWAAVTEPPEPLHPGARIALARLTMDELGIARAIAAGDLTSPQRYRNVTLFAVRITGTGAAYRTSLGEAVWRDPSLYLNPEFLARCNGLPVIWEHPKKGLLTSKEFEDRIIGTIMLPYIVGDEVWGIAKIYDDSAAALMEAGQLSTSPGVALRNADSTKLTLEDGTALLIEGAPVLLDHLAVCELGVWDKGGPPAGVISETEREPLMTDDEKAAKEREDKARADADEKAAAEAKEAKEREDSARRDAEGSNLDRVLKALDAVCGRMDEFGKRIDTMEKRDRKDDDVPAELAADKARRDADEAAEKEREDAARRDAEVKKLADAVANMPKSMTDADYAEMADAQARADAAYGAFGNRAPPPLQGEATRAYRVRLAKGIQKHSPAWNSVALAELPDNALSIAETAIYTDTAAAARSPDDVAPGQLREIRRRDAAGREIVEFVGDPASWMGAFRTPPRVLARPFFNAHRQAGG